MKASELRQEWRKDRGKDFIRELQMDEQRLEEKANENDQG